MDFVKFVLTVIKFVCSHMETDNLTN